MPGDGAATNSARFDSVPSQATVRKRFERQGPGPGVGASFCSGQTHLITVMELLLAAVIRCVTVKEQPAAAPDAQDSRGII